MVWEIYTCHRKRAGVYMYVEEGGRGREHLSITQFT